MCHGPSHPLIYFIFAGLFLPLPKTNMPGFASPEFFVRRRFSDFVWLHQTLCEKHLDVLVPPLPEKEKLSTPSPHTPTASSLPCLTVQTT
jgi:hypothetical protein